MITWNISHIVRFLSVWSKERSFFDYDKIPFMHILLHIFFFREIIENLMLPKNTWKRFFLNVLFLNVIKARKNSIS